MRTDPAAAGRILQKPDFSNALSDFLHCNSLNRSEPAVKFSLRACLKTPSGRRVRPRGLQDSRANPSSCRPGALTGRVFKQALKDTATQRFVSQFRPITARSQTGIIGE